jgi:hypothetical protein
MTLQENVGVLATIQQNPMCRVLSLDFEWIH